MQILWVWKCSMFPVLTPFSEKYLNFQNFMGNVRYLPWKLVIKFAVLLGIFMKTYLQKMERRETMCWYQLWIAPKLSFLIAENWNLPKKSLKLVSSFLTFSKVGQNYQNKTNLKWNALYVWVWEISLKIQIQAVKFHQNSNFYYFYHWLIA